MAVPIRKPVNAATGKTVEANQKSIDALPLNSGEWPVDGVPGLFVRCRATGRSFRLQRRVRGILVKKSLAAATLKEARAEARRTWDGMRPPIPPAVGDEGAEAPLTLSIAIEKFLRGKVPQPATKTQQIARYNAERYLSHWSVRMLEDISKDPAGIRDLQQRVTENHGKSTSNQVVRLLAAVYRWHLSVTAKKGTSLAVETEPGVGLRSGLRRAQKWGRS